MNGILSQTNWRLYVWKLYDRQRSYDGDRGKIKIQKYPANAMKNKLSVRANLSWPSLKENCGDFANE